jgi:hypothetical protein
MESKQDNMYFTELIKKFNFIQSILVTDYEGALLSHATREEEDSTLEESDKLINKARVTLSIHFNSVLDQTANLEKWKTKYLVTSYETFTIFQSKISKSTYIHIICDNNKFNYEIAKEIHSEVKEKLSKVEKELEQVFQSVEN